MKINPTHKTNSPHSPAEMKRESKEVSKETKTIAMTGKQLADWGVTSKKPLPTSPATKSPKSSSVPKNKEMMSTRNQVVTVAQRIILGIKSH